MDYVQNGRKSRGTFIAIPHRSVRLHTTDFIQTGRLEGRAALQDGSSIPGVTVNVSSPTLQGTRSQTTWPNGDFIFKFLPPGVYNVTFELSGMVKTVVQTVTVALGGTARTEATDLFVTTYNGVITSNLFASPQYSQKTFKSENFGGTSADIHDSPLRPCEVRRHRS